CQDRQPPPKLIFETSLICQGHPSVHLLPLKTGLERIGTFLKKTIGAEKLSRKNKTILLLGETGSGKSTIINALFNFAIGTEWTDDVWCEIVEGQSEANKKVNQSQTSDVTVYEIHEGNLDFSLRVIDSPGLGDTRGSDELLTERLLDLFQSEDGVSEVHAVGLVLKASENRLTDRMAYVFNSVTSLFDKDMEQKIVPLITHSDGRKPTNALQALNAANVRSARDENNKPLYFLFDNCQRDDRTEGTKYLEMAYDTTSKNMENFIKFLQQESKDLGETVKVLKERISLRENIKKLKDQVQPVKEKEKEIHQAREALDKYKRKMESTKNFSREEIETYTDQEPVDQIGIIFYSGAMCCRVCKENCHYPGCTWARSPAQCDVIKNRQCNKCNCPVEDHIKGDKKYVEKFRKVQKINEEMKATFKRNQEKKDETKQRLDILQKEMFDLKQTKDQNLDKAFRIIEKLQKIALNVDSVSSYVHLDFLIENMKENGDAEKVQTLERMRERMDDRNKAGAKYLNTMN
uniref:AIG1-type G domain-containing protein n=1 Tax=Neogobius melanostomus TaxID=47308 RepID=A0A8C6TSX6_9GOBI